MQINNGMVKWIKAGFVLVTTTAAVILWVWQSQAAQDAERNGLSGDVRVMVEKFHNCEKANAEILKELKEMGADVGDIKVNVGELRTGQTTQAQDIRDLKTDVRELRRHAP